MSGGIPLRIPPLPPEQWSDDAEAQLRKVLPAALVDSYLDRGDGAVRPPNIFTTLINRPDLAGPFLRFNMVLLYRPRIDGRVRELLILRIAYRTQQEYEWVQHTRLAQRPSSVEVGEQITPAEIDDIVVGGRAERWTPLEAALLDATDQLIDDHRVSDATWAALSEHLDEEALLEVLFVVGTYTLLAMVFNGCGMQLDPEMVGDALPLPPLD